MAYIHNLIAEKYEPGSLAAVDELADFVEHVLEQLSCVGSISE
jgi:hypothetical protein